MKSIFHSVLLASLYATLMLSAPAAEENLLKNGTFSEGTTSWILMATNGAKANMDTTASEGQLTALRINVSQPGQMRYHVQLLQKGVPLTAGKSYRIHFRARSEPNIDIVVVLLNPAKPADKLWRQDNVSISKEWKDYTYEFVATTDLESAIFGLSGLAQQIGDYYFSDVSLISVNP